MASTDIKDLNIRYKGHPKYNEYRLTEDRPIEIIVQKLEVLLLTNRGDILGDPNFGCNLEHYLWRTDTPNDSIQKNIYEQIYKYIPDITNYTFSVKVELYQGTVRDIMSINIIIEDNSVNFLLK